MFPHRYFAARYFAPRYWEPVDGVTPDIPSGGGPGDSRRERRVEIVWDDEEAIMAALLLS